ncbi:hypothetical protein CIG75_20185 [Tumebacillus algifaecis]|uniref:Uncharacterized protein n=1 Tax=Tumebacillus algifaecis TaxID=1214604 RepID=A0A223D5W3_9BACL|nr:hypothetical protein [Tumebacillus algifaecis]ASS76989.1 hypothetical protein CIG75_20185 [Tumebacillus algifaecis]
MDGIESFDSHEPQGQESHLEHNRRLRKERRKRWGMMMVTAMTAFSTTILLGVENTGSTNALFTASVVNASTVKAAANFCDEDTHRNGDKHKPHPPGNGYGHCKPHKNQDDAPATTEEQPALPEEDKEAAPEENQEVTAPEPESSVDHYRSSPQPADLQQNHSQTPPPLA